jgi:hypothetical protein
MKPWRIRVNETKSTHVTFTLRREDCPAVYLNGRHIPQDSTVKYLGIHLDCRLTWKTHNFAKRKHLGLLFQRTYWILGRKSTILRKQTSTLQVYTKTCMDIWHTTLGHGLPFKHRNPATLPEILQRFQNKTIRTMVNAPWYVPNKLLHTDLQMPTIREEITKFSTNHRAKLLTHPNNLTSNLLTEQGPGRLTL